MRNALAVQACPDRRSSNNWWLKNEWPPAASFLFGAAAFAFLGFWYSIINIHFVPRRNSRRPGGLLCCAKRHPWRPPHVRGKTAMVLAEQQPKTARTSLAARTAEAGKLADFRVQKTAVDREWKALEADLGPVRYLATLLGSTDEATTRRFIVVVLSLILPPSCCSWPRLMGKR